MAGALNVSVVCCSFILASPEPPHKLVFVSHTRLFGRRSRGLPAEGGWGKQRRFFFSSSLHSYLLLMFVLFRQQRDTSAICRDLLRTMEWTLLQRSEGFFLPVLEFHFVTFLILKYRTLKVK